MKITIAKTAGFCMGVRRAVEMALDTNRQGEGPIYTYGPLIHNPQVLKIFEEKGISTLSEIPEKASGSVLIRAHGVPPQEKEKLATAGFTVMDATCPRVIKVQTIIRKHTANGYAAVIVGDKDHPEVIGLLGYAGDVGHVVDNMSDLKALPRFEKAIIVAQTTQNTKFFDEVKAWVKDSFPHYKIFNTICDSTEKRQAEVSCMAASVDAVVVVGGYNSGNTKRLAEIATQTGKPALHVENESEIDEGFLADAEHVGITAGASTPNWIIKRIYRKLESMPLHGRGSWRRAAFVLQRSLLLTNIYVALGAGALCYACANLQGVDNARPQILISMLYVQSMHILNHLIGRKSDRYNDPDRAAFYAHNLAWLTVLATAAGAAGLFTAYTLGAAPFAILFVMSILGFSYNLRVIPSAMTGSPETKRLKDIPGSKTILIAMAWGVVTAVFPAFSETATIGIGTLLAFVWAAGMVFVRTAFFEVLDMQGDRIVGKETIPILIGGRRSMRLLKTVLLGLAAIPIAASVLAVFTPLGFILSISAVLMLMVLLASEREYMLPGLKLEFIIESTFILTGALTLLWVLLKQF